MWSMWIYLDSNINKNGYGTGYTFQCFNQIVGICSQIGSTAFLVNIAGIGKGVPILLRRPIECDWILEIGEHLFRFFDARIENVQIIEKFRIGGQTGYHVSGQFGNDSMYVRCILSIGQRCRHLSHTAIVQDVPFARINVPREQYLAFVVFAMECTIEIQTTGAICAILDVAVWLQIAGGEMGHQNTGQHATERTHLSGEEMEGGGENQL